MAIDYAFPIVGTVGDQEQDHPVNVFTMPGEDNDSNHPVLKQLKDKIQELENELAMREETLQGVQEIVDKFWDSLPEDYQQAMNDRFDN